MSNEASFKHFEYDDRKYRSIEIDVDDPEVIEEFINAVKVLTRQESCKKCGDFERVVVLANLVKQLEDAYSDFEEQLKKDLGDDTIGGESDDKEETS